MVARYNTLRKRAILPPPISYNLTRNISHSEKLGAGKTLSLLHQAYASCGRAFVSCPLLAWKEIMENYGKLFNNTQGAPCG